MYAINRMEATMESRINRKGLLIDPAVEEGKRQLALEWTRRSTMTIYTAPQAAKYLGLSYRQFRRWMPYIPVIREAKGWRYYRQCDLDDFFRRLAQEPQPQKKNVQVKRKGRIKGPIEL